MSQNALTPRQLKILEFMRSYQADNHEPPTIRAIMAHTGLKSPNGVMSHISALEKKGFVHKTGSHWKSIEPVTTEGIELLKRALGNMRYGHIEQALIRDIEAFLEKTNGTLDTNLQASSGEGISDGRTMAHGDSNQEVAEKCSKDVRP